MKHLALLFILLSYGVQSGELYRWVDANGKVTYGDKAPMDATQIESKKFSGSELSGNSISYEMRRAHQNFPLTLYVSESCREYCDQARKLLSTRGIPFSEKNLKTQQEIDAFKELSGGSSVPTLGIGKNFLQGFQAGQWHRELDMVGYPKTAFHSPPASPPVYAPASQVTPTTP